MVMDELINQACQFYQSNKDFFEITALSSITLGSLFIYSYLGFKKPKKNSPITKKSQMDEAIFRAYNGD